MSSRKKSTTKVGTLCRRVSTFLQEENTQLAAKRPKQWVECETLPKSQRVPESSSSSSSQTSPTGYLYAVSVFDQMQTAGSLKCPLWTSENEMITHWKFKSREISVLLAFPLCGFLHLFLLVNKWGKWSVCNAEFLKTRWPLASCKWKEQASWGLVTFVRKWDVKYQEALFLGARKIHKDKGQSWLRPHLLCVPGQRALKVMDPFSKTEAVGRFDSMVTVCWPWWSPQADPG